MRVGKFPLARNPYLLPPPPSTRSSDSSKSIAVVLSSNLAASCSESLIAIGSNIHPSISQSTLPSLSPRLGIVALFPPVTECLIQGHVAASHHGLHPPLPHHNPTCLKPEPPLSLLAPGSFTASDLGQRRRRPRPTV